MQKTDSSDIQKELKTAWSEAPSLEGSREAYLLHLADNSLILSHRNSEWCGHGPVLEQDIALTNISLDLIGQARNFYQYAASLIGNTDEDQLAGMRPERAFKNLLLVEQPNGDWGQTVLRQYLFSQYQYLLFEQLQQHADQQLAAICAKALKEIKYHLRWSSEWVIRLGDGTAESNERMKNAVEELWRYTGEMFMPAAYEQEAQVDIVLLKDAWNKKVASVFEAAALSVPGDCFMQSGGKTGVHTEYMGYILTELQYMQRAYPGCEW